MLYADGGDVYAVGGQQVWRLSGDAPQVAISEPAIAGGPLANMSFGTAIAENAEWIAVSAPRASISDPKYGFVQGYIALYRKSDLSRPARLLSALPCAKDTRDCLSHASLPGDALSIAGGVLYAADPGFSPDLGASPLGGGAVFMFRLPQTAPPSSTAKGAY